MVLERVWVVTSVETGQMQGRAVSFDEANDATVRRRPTRNCVASTLGSVSAVRQPTKQIISKCGGWVDMRDLGMVFEHEQPLPHPKKISRSERQ
jgi:hypothetical protein